MKLSVFHFVRTKRPRDFTKSLVGSDCALFVCLSAFSLCLDFSLSQIFHFVWIFDQESWWDPTSAAVCLLVPCCPLHPRPIHYPWISPLDNTQDVTDTEKKRKEKTIMIKFKDKNTKKTTKQRQQQR